MDRVAHFLFHRVITQEVRRLSLFWHDDRIPCDLPLYQDHFFFYSGRKRHRMAGIGDQVDLIETGGNDTVGAIEFSGIDQADDTLAVADHLRLTLLTSIFVIHHPLLEIESVG